MPYANRLTIGVMALVAEEEAHATSARTKAALAAAKARGTKPGNPSLTPGDSATAASARAAWSVAANRRAAEVLPYVTAARRAGAVTLQRLADALTARGVRTPRGGDGWHPWQVRRLLDRWLSDQRTLDFCVRWGDALDAMVSPRFLLERGHKGA
jgi:hypothetical protein